MLKQILRTFRSFGWRQWLVAAAFLLVLGFTGIYAYRTVHKTVSWKVHADEPIKGWMSIGHVAHTYHVPPQALYKALGLPNKPDKRPLHKIATEQHRSMKEIDAVLLEAIAHAREPNPEKTPPPIGEVPAR